MNLTPKKMRALEVFFLYTTYFMAICISFGVWKIAEIAWHLVSYLQWTN